MPMAKAKKTEVKDLLSEKFSRASAAIIAEYRGISAADMADMRRKLRELGGEVRVLNNRLAKKAIADNETLSHYEPMLEHFTGPLAVVYAYDDAVAVVKSAMDLGKANKDLKVTRGMVDNNVVSLDELKQISSLPSKEVLVAQILSTLVAPHRNLMAVINGVSGALVRTISAIKDQKQ